MNRKETNDEIPLLIKLPFAEGDIRRDSEAIGRTEQTTLTSGAGGPLMGSQVIAMIRKAGGYVWLDQDGRVLTKGVSGELLKRLQETMYLVRAILRDQVASLPWENSGKDPSWWRYPEYRWSWPDQKLLPADQSAFTHWLRERCTADRRCSSAVKFLFWAFCEEHGEELPPVQFLEFLQAAGFTVVDGFVDGLVLGSCHERIPACRNNDEEGERVSLKAAAAREGHH